MLEITRTAFPDRVVDKSLARRTTFRRLPRFVSEYLIARQVLRPDDPDADVARLEAVVAEHLPEAEQREVVKHRLMEDGRFVLIDEVSVKVDLRLGVHWASLPSLGIDDARIGRDLVEAFPALLFGGLWGTARLCYEPDVEIDRKTRPVRIEELIPLRASAPDVEEIRAGREQLTTEEWEALLLASVGYDARSFESQRVRRLLLARLIPLCEPNVNLLELGPRQTGKTFLLRNTSPHVFTISGGKATPANLFFHLVTKQVGLIGTRRVVVFDEIAHARFRDSSTLSLLKDFMESGEFSRGTKRLRSPASLVFAGNIDVDGARPHPRLRRLSDALPPELRDTAFFDRLHGFLPGWEIPRLTPRMLSPGLGFVVDYFAEVLDALRREDRTGLVRSYLRGGSDWTERDYVAVTRLASGLSKLLHPSARPGRAELIDCIELAIELRQRVLDELTRMAPGEFRDRRLRWW